MVNCCIFDLDGVIVDTAKYHFLAWKRLADSLDIRFTEEDNERLKGVSRIDSLNTILALEERELSSEEFNKALSLKNELYLEKIKTLETADILPGVLDFLNEIKANNMSAAVGSASKNAVFILERLELTQYFDAIIDGNQVKSAKPNPEVFLTAAKAVDCSPDNCLVFEDAVAGVKAARNAGMKVVGIGDATTLAEADMVMPGFALASLPSLLGTLAEPTH